MPAFWTAPQERLPAIGALVVALIACGGAPEPAPAPMPPATSTASTLTAIPGAGPEPLPSSAAMRSMLAPATGDLDAMSRRGYVRVLVVPSRTHYTVVDGSQLGATVDAGVAFEAFLNSKLAAGQPSIELLFVPTREDMLVKDLLAGRGDIAANLLFTFERDEQVAFPAPARSGIRELVVTAPGVPPLVSLEDVAGRSIHVRRSSDHHASLVRLNDQLKTIDKPGCTIVAADESLTEEDLLARVNDGTIPATLVDDYVLDAWRPAFDKISVNRDVAVSQDGIQSWAVRKDAPALLALITEFMKTHDLKGRPQRAQ